MNTPHPAVGDGAMGFRATLDQVYPDTRQQRCLVHKAANVLNTLPQSRQSESKTGLREIWMAAARNGACTDYGRFIETCQDKYPKTTQCLKQDRDVLAIFYNFPAQHWRSTRTANPAESTFATTCLRTQRTRGCLTQNRMLHRLSKLGFCAAKTWRRPQSFNILTKVIEGVKFGDGIEVIKSAQAVD